MSAKLCVVTGTDSGIGRAAALDLVSRGHRVVAVCLDIDRGRALAVEAGGGLEPIACDFSSLDEVRLLAATLLERYPRIDALVNVAGVVFDAYGETQDGFERQIGINHLAPYLLTRLLLPRLQESTPARVVVVASRAHRYHHIHKDDPNMKADYSGLYAYRQSKLANMLFALKLSGDVAGSGVTVTSLHPGVTKTQIGAKNAVGWMKYGWKILSIFGRPVSKAAGEIADFAVDEAYEGKNGLYYRAGKLIAPAIHATDASEQKWLWDWSAQAVGLK